MTGRNSRLRICNQKPEQVEMALLDFENRYHPYKSRWDFELVSQGTCCMTAQLVDRSFEPPRGKGQSDSPYLHMSYNASGSDVLLSWNYRWKSWRRTLSILLLLALLAFLAGSILLYSGQLRVLHLSIWCFWASLYGGWIFQHLWHDRMTMGIFRDLLALNFEDLQEA